MNYLKGQDMPLGTKQQWYDKETRNTKATTTIRLSTRR